LQIEATVDDGIPDNTVHVIAENGRSLKLKQGFDE
jgi:hypothetical protein